MKLLKKMGIYYINNLDKDIQNKKPILGHYNLELAFCLII